VRCSAYHIGLVSVNNLDLHGSRTLSILYSGSIRTISILEAERVCGARRCVTWMHFNTNTVQFLDRVS